MYLYKMPLKKANGRRNDNGDLIAPTTLANPLNKQSLISNLEMLFSFLPKLWSTISIRRLLY